MSKTIYILYKCPEEFDDEEHNPYFERGVFPTGEVMGIHEDREDAEAQKEYLEEHSPSERFGDSMDEAPYSFYIHNRRMNDETLF